MFPPRSRDLILSQWLPCMAHENLARLWIRLWLSFSAGAQLHLCVISANNSNIPVATKVSSYRAVREAEFQSTTGESYQTSVWYFLSVGSQGHSEGPIPHHSPNGCPYCRQSQVWQPLEFPKYMLLLPLHLSTTILTLINCDAAVIRGLLASYFPPVARSSALYSRWRASPNQSPNPIFRGLPPGTTPRTHSVTV